MGGDIKVKFIEFIALLRPLLIIFFLVLLFDNAYSKDKCKKVFKKQLIKIKEKDRQYKPKQYKDFDSAKEMILKNHDKFIRIAEEKDYIDNVLVNSLNYGGNLARLDLFEVLKTYCGGKKIFIFTTDRKIKVNCGAIQFQIDPAGLYFRIWDTHGERYLNSQGKTPVTDSFKKYNLDTHFDYGAIMGEEPTHIRFKKIIDSTPHIKKIYIEKVDNVQNLNAPMP